MSERSTRSTQKVLHEPQHPPWTEMIMECIVTAPDGTRNGVSRPAIKKFVDSKYHLSMNVATASQLNHAIARGIERGVFILPKGPSGKVKLASRGTVEIHEKKNPPSGSVRVTGTTEATKTNTTSFLADERPSKTVPLTKRYTSMAKKARVTPAPWH